MSEPTRRELMKMAALAAAASTAGKASAAALPPAPGPATQPRFFTAAEFRLVDELTEMIIPGDGHSPGARAAQVAAYIDARLADGFEQEAKQEWRAGLARLEKLSAEMHGRPFLEATPEQRLALLVRISENEEKPQTPEEKFFRELKSHTAYAYYTSEIGIHKEMEYKGNRAITEFSGYEAK